MLKFVFLVQMNNNCKLLSLNDYQKTTFDINDFNHLFYSLFRSFFGNTEFVTGQRFIIMQFRAPLHAS